VHGLYSLQGICKAYIDVLHIKALNGSFLEVYCHVCICKLYAKNIEIYSKAYATKVYKNATFIVSYYVLLRKKIYSYYVFLCFILPISFTLTYYINTTYDILLCLIVSYNFLQSLTMFFLLYSFLYTYIYI